MPSAAPLVVSVIILALGSATADDGVTKRRADQEALKPFAGLVGEWRGVGQAQRGSTKGVWKETAGWAWKLDADHAALELKLDGNKYLKELRIRPGKAAGDFVAEGTTASGETRPYVGKFNDRKQLILTADKPKADEAARLTLSPLHETRFLLLLEAADGAKSFKRLGEVGYTREGVAFAAGDSGPVCIVTQGRGTIAVKYKGETYYVCCSGCKDLFDEDPEAVLAEAKARSGKKP